MDARRILESCPQFGQLDSASLGPLVAMARTQRFEKGETILRQLSEVPGVFVVGEGLVRVFQLSPGGKEHVLELAGPGPHRVDGLRVRGGLEVARTATGLRVVNRVGLSDYLAGTLGREIYPSWHDETLGPLRRIDTRSAPDGWFRSCDVPSDVAVLVTIDFVGRQNHRYEVDVCSDGESALKEICQGKGWDLVLADLRLADLDGIALYKKVREALGDEAPTFVILTVWLVVGATRMVVRPAVAAPVRAG